jgi:putative ABC transport system permease protein
MGANGGNLIRQFLGESMIIVAFSMIVSFLIVLLALPYFGNMMQKELKLDSANLPFLVVTTVVNCLLTGLLAGSYPAFFMSSLKPVQVLKGKTHHS